MLKSEPTRVQNPCCVDDPHIASDAHRKIINFVLFPFQGWHMNDSMDQQNSAAAARWWHANCHYEYERGKNLTKPSLCRGSRRASSNWALLKSECSWLEARNVFVARKTDTVWRISSSINTRSFQTWLQNAHKVLPLQFCFLTKATFRLRSSRRDVKHTGGTTVGETVVSCGKSGERRVCDREVAREHFLEQCGVCTQRTTFRLENLPYLPRVNKTILSDILYKSYSKTGQLEMSDIHSSGWLSFTTPDWWFYFQMFRLKEWHCYTISKSYCLWEGAMDLEMAFSLKPSDARSRHCTS